MKILLKKSKNESLDTFYHAVNIIQEIVALLIHLSEVETESKMDSQIYCYAVLRNVCGDTINLDTALELNVLHYSLLTVGEILKSHTQTDINSNLNSDSNAKPSLELQLLQKVNSKIFIRFIYQS